MKSLTLLTFQLVTEKASLSELVKICSDSDLYGEIGNREPNLWKDILNQMGRRGEEVARSRRDLKLGSEWFELCRNLLKGTSYLLGSRLRADNLLERIPLFSVMKKIKGVADVNVEGMLPKSNTPGYHLLVLRNNGGCDFDFYGETFEEAFDAALEYAVCSVMLSESLKCLDPNHISTLEITDGEIIPHEKLSGFPYLDELQDFLIALIKNQADRSATNPDNRHIALKFNGIRFRIKLTQVVMFEH